MPLRHLWSGSTCQSADRSPLRHARMPLRYLWVGSPCRRPSRSPLCHVITCIRWAPPASHALGSARLSESSAVRGHRSSGYYPVNQSRLGIKRFFHDPYPWSRFASRLRISCLPESCAYRSSISCQPLTLLLISPASIGIGT